MPIPDPIELLRQLTAIDSVNPDLVPGGAGEAEISSFCADWLADHGFEVRQLENTPGRPSIVGVARGTGGGRSLMLNGHLDTVGVAGYLGDPFELVEDEGTLSGRGTFDMKGGVAAIMAAAAAATTAGLAGDVLVTLVADEEFGSLGTEEVLGQFTADAAIVTEPTELAVVLAHRGFAWFEITLNGLAAHGSMPEQGVDAILHAAQVLAALNELQSALGRSPAHPLLGHGSVRVSTIHGGTDAATVADRCRLTVERRTLPGETSDQVERQLRDLLTEVSDRMPGMTFTLERLIARTALECDPHSAIARTVLSHTERVLGKPAVTRGEPFWTDAGLIAGAGIPCLVIGVAGGGAHAAREWVTRDSVVGLTDILTATIGEFCGPTG